MGGPVTLRRIGLARSMMVVEKHCKYKKHALFV